MRIKAPDCRTFGAVWLGLLLWACGGATGHAASAPPGATPQARCSALNGQVFATPDGAAAITSSSFNAANGVPEHCDVRGQIPPALHFEVRLPTAWNQRLFYTGGAGFDGAIPQPTALASADGYVIVGSDGGHPQAANQSWAYDPEELNDYAFRSVHKTLTAARAVIKRFYGHPATRAYFEGCSNGGREGLIEAQRYPDDFDGIIARAPAVYFTGLMLAGNRIMRQFFASGATQLSGAKIATLSKAVLAACDGLDNRVDGIIGKWAACNFDPATLRCKAGADNDSCLTDAQVTTVQTLYSPSRFKDAGHALYYSGWPAGGEAEPAGWPFWVAARATGLPDFSTQFIRYFLVHDPGYDTMKFVPEQNRAAIAARAALLDAGGTDYAKFRAHDGKLILFHGTADWGISFNSTALYFGEVAAAAGGQAAADSFVEFYAAPGVQHCALGGPVPDFVDLLTPLQKWVENGVPPSRQNLLLLQVDPRRQSVLRSRPLCRFPRYPHYVDGNPDLAASYTCAWQTVAP